MTPAAGLVALYCMAAAPAPTVGSDIYRALRGEIVAASPARNAVADAILGAAARHRRSRP